MNSQLRQLRRGQKVPQFACVSAADLFGSGYLSVMLGSVVCWCFTCKEWRDEHSRWASDGGQGESC